VEENPSHAPEIEHPDGMYPSRMDDRGRVKLPVALKEYLEKFDSASQHLRGVIERMLPLLVGDHAPLVANLRAAEERYALYRTGFLSLAKESIADKSMTAQAANQKMHPLKANIYAFESHVDTIVQESRKAMEGTMAAASALASSRLIIIVVLFIAIAGDRFDGHSFLAA